MPLTIEQIACDEAERALLAERAAGREPDPRSWAAIEAKRAWLRGEITDSELAIARDAAWVVARAVIRAAAWETWAAVWAAQASQIVRLRDERR